MLENITSLKNKNGALSWINITNAQDSELAYLKKKFKFNEVDLQDSHTQNTAQRPKFYFRGNYCFLILQFPFYNKHNRTIEAEEINFFIGKNYIITVHRDRLPPIIELFNTCYSDKFYAEQYLGGSNTMMLYDIIVRLQEYCYPILDHLSIDVQSIEKNIFAGREREMMRESLLAKRNILNFRRIMEAHRDVLHKIAKAKVSFFNVEKSKIYYGDLIDHTKNIWDILNGQKEMIEALESTNTSLVSFRLNDIMRLLTLFSVIVFPLTLIAGIFSMRIDNSMPFIDQPYGFWLIVGIMATISLIMLFFFKRKRWM